MRATSFYIPLLAGITLMIGGCVLAVEPLSKTGGKLAIGRDGEYTTLPIGTEPVRHDARWKRCHEGFVPLPETDRPKLGHTDSTDKTKLSMELANHVHALDDYIVQHHEKELAAYRAWRKECANSSH